MSQRLAVLKAAVRQLVFLGQAGPDLEEPVTQAWWTKKALAWMPASTLWELKALLDQGQEEELN